MDEDQTEAPTERTEPQEAPGTGACPPWAEPGADRPIRTREPKKVWKPAFLIALARTGNPSASARAAGVARSTACEARKSDPEFAAAWAEAVDELADQLEQKATELAFKGDVRVLLATLRALRPEKWGDRARVQVESPPVAPPPDAAAVAAYEEQAARIAKLRELERQLGEYDAHCSQG